MSVTDIIRLEKEKTNTFDDERCDWLPSSLVSLGIVSIIFAAMPNIDIVVSRLFWDEAQGFKFNNNEVVIAIRDANRLLTWTVVGAAVMLLVSSPFLKHLKNPPAPHKLLFVLTFFAMGPGLGVHLIKMAVGRARPRALEEFGGRALFTPPWELTDQCARNCSFVSGEAATAFALLTLVVFVRPKYALPYLTVVGAAAAVFSLNRVVLGAHFLSDVVVAWSLMLVLAVPLWRIVSRNAPQIDAIFARSSRPAPDPRTGLRQASREPFQPRRSEAEPGGPAFDR